MALGKRSPFEELERLFERMNRQFEERMGEMDMEMLGMESMSVDIADQDDEFVVTADLPGFEKEDIDLRISDSTLRIRAERSEEMEESEEGEYIRRERSQRTVSRTVPLPEPVDEESVRARYHNGVLTVTLPKMHAGEDAKSIDIE